ncbi:MAG: hypothetical protein K2X34_04730 [Hyphomonadaceae bacterium]|nr:hypothetical protein [Hyphomonadaceae bacterium]
MRYLLFAGAACVLAACGQSTETAETPPAPQSLLEQVQGMGPEEQLVWAVTALAEQQRANATLTPPCANVRATESRGVIPANVDPQSIYAAHVGALVLSVQCGNLVSRERMDPNEHWLLVIAAGATAPTVVNCANARGEDDCPREVPVVEAAPAPAAP